MIQIWRSFGALHVSPEMQRWHRWQPWPAFGRQTSSHAEVRRCACRGAQAGLLIAETEFALQVESDIAPYKGLLMGLFFMTVGMEISAGLFFAKMRTVLAGIAGLLLGKVQNAAELCHAEREASGLGDGAHARRRWP